ncbi:MAG: hypothetical protein WAU45_11190 [Blastocatellia bacterium]
MNSKLCMANQPSTIVFDEERPICRGGIVLEQLTNGMVFIRHPKFSSQIINRESWSFLQMCDGRGLDELNEQIAKSLGFRLTLDQLRSSVKDFAAGGVFEGSTPVIRNYRLLDASALLKFLSPLMRPLTARWFAALTLAALLACLVLLAADWGRFIEAVSGAAREHPVATLLLYYMTFIPIALIHEVAHALVAAGHGGEVPEIVLRGNGHFAVITNTSVLKDRSAHVWYLSMGTVTDIYIWLALLVAFHYSASYVVLMFLLPQTIYFLLYSYSIFKNSDFLKAVAAWLDQPVPAHPWQFVRDNWRKRPASGSARKLLYAMTASLAVKLAVTACLIWTFIVNEYRVLVLYAIYRALVYTLGNWPNWLRRLQYKLQLASGQPKG